MCASYGAVAATLVSTRSTVPGTLARAAALTLAAVSPVSSVSVLPLTVCPPRDGSCLAGVVVVLLDAAGVAVVDVAAPATAEPLTAAAPTTATVTSLERILDMTVLLVWWGDFCGAWTSPPRGPQGLPENHLSAQAVAPLPSDLCPAQHFRVD